MPPCASCASCAACASCPHHLVRPHNTLHRCVLHTCDVRRRTYFATIVVHAHYSLHSYIHTHIHAYIICHPTYCSCCIGYGCICAQIKTENNKKGAAEKQKQKQGIQGTHFSSSMHNAQCTMQQARTINRKTESS